MHTKRKNKNHRFVFGVLGILIATVLFVPVVAFAQFNLDSNLPTVFAIADATDLTTTIIAVVQWVLALVGLVAVIVMIYGGFIWMTARGEVDKIRKAKKILINAAIGLAIILLAWVIVAFIVDFVEGTTGNSTICEASQIGICTQTCKRCQVVGAPPAPDPTCNPGLCTTGPGLPAWLVMEWGSPTGSGVFICTMIQAQFSEILDETTVTDSNIIVTLPDNIALDPAQQGLIGGANCTENKNCLSGLCDQGLLTCVGDQVAGTLTSLLPPTPPVVPTKRFKFQPNAEFEKDAFYHVQVTSGLQSAIGHTLPIGGAGWDFFTGTLSDTTPPTVITTAPQQPFPLNDTQDVCLKAPVAAYFSEDMDTFSINNTTVDVLNLGNGNKVNLSNYDFFTAGDRFSADPTSDYETNSQYEVTLASGDPAVKTGPGIRDTCGNPLDGDQSGATEFPSANASGTDDYASDPKGNFGAAGDPDWIFETGITAQCVPVITNITPASTEYSRNGAPTINISGEYLYPGADVTFAQSVLSSSGCFDNNWIPTSICSIAYLSSQLIQTEVPSGAITDGQAPNGARDGDMTVQTNAGTSGGTFFGINSPRILGVSPTAGPKGQWINLIATDPTSQMNFGIGTGRVWFRLVSTNYNPADDIEGQLAPCSAGSWTPSSITVIAPDTLVSGEQYAIQVERADGFRSNLILFQLNNSQIAPGLCPLVNPACGGNPQGNPNANLTAEGQFFGNAPGSVEFDNRSGGSSKSIVPPVANWSDSLVQFSLPSDTENAAYLVNLLTQGGIASASQPFNVPCSPGANLIYSNSCNMSAAPPVLPSPNPYPDTQNICVNLNEISFEFSEAVNYGIGDFDVRECPNGRAVCDTIYNSVPFTLNSVSASIGVRFGLSNTLNADTWYRVTVNGGITNLSGVLLGNDQTWFFKTRADATPCVAEVLSLNVTNFAPGIYSEPYSSHPNTIEYTGSPLTNSCQIITAPGTWNWTVTDTAEAVCTAGCGNTGVQSVDTVLYNSLVDDGLTSVRADLGSLSAEKPLNVQLNYCQSNADCTCNGNAGVCDLTAQKCEPYVENVLQPSGPKDTLVTVSGCFFGNTPGQVEFIDQNPPNSSLLGVNLCTLPQWTNTSILIGTPDFPLGTVTDVNVQSVYGAGLYLDSSNTGVFTYANTCGGLVPPGLCSISPSAGGPGVFVTLEGKNFPLDNATGTVEFNGATALATNTTWDPSGDIVKTNVPVGAISGDVTVVAGGTCPSNPVGFSVACSNNGQCASGCCQSGACVAAGLCSNGGVGQACQVPPHLDVTCQSGPTNAADSNYTCIDTLGFTTAKALTVPPPNQGTLCQFCCDADPNNDGNLNDADVSTTGLVCTPIDGGGICSSQSLGVQTRGLYCGCTNNAECGLGTACSTQNDPGGRCCRPITTVTMPASFDCLNSALTLNFSDVMDRASINASTIIFSQGGVQLDGRYITTGTQLLFMPNAPLANGTVTVTINSGVRNIYGIPLTSTIITLTSNPVPGAEVCKVSDVKFTWSTISDTYPAPGIFTCAQPDGCVGDHDSATPENGNQNLWSAVAVDSQGNVLSGFLTAFTYHWEEQDARDIYSIETGCPNDTVFPFNCELTSNPSNGSSYLQVAVTDADPSDGFDYGNVTRRARVSTFMCENPWPNPYTGAFPYEDSTYNATQVPPNYNFSLAYCRSEGGELPDLHIGTIQGGITAPLVDSFTPVLSGVDELLRQYAFFVTDDLGNRLGADTIGMRVMENELRLAPDLWFRRTTGEEAAGSSLAVDGFPAMRVGRTTYISATNDDLSGSPMYSNMYILSYSDGATPQTVAVYEQLLKYIKFNTNVISGDDLTHIRRDVFRIQDLGRSSIALSDYQKRFGEYPNLSAGSYINSFSVSTWPSWLGTLSQTLETVLPRDPINAINMCPLSFGSVAHVDTGQNMSGVALDSAGQVYAVALNGNKELFKCDSSLTSCQVVYSFGAGLPIGVDVDVSNGDILVATQNLGIFRFDPSDFSLKATYSLVAGYPSAAHVTTDPAGNMYVTRTNSDNGIYKYDKDGNATGVEISYGPATTCNNGGDPCPLGLQFYDGLLYVVDRNMRTLTMYDENLQLQKQLVLPMVAGVDAPVGLAVYGNSIFITNHQNGSSLWEVAKDLSGVINIAQDGNLANPYEVAVNGNGIYIANYMKLRIDKYAKNESASSTCWDENTSQFAAAAGSHVYAYSYLSNDPALYANLEYEGPGNWANTGPNFDACGPFANGTCPTFNFVWNKGIFEPWVTLYQTTGVPDTTKPIIVSFTVPDPITGTTTITAVSTDAGSGLDKAEFYIDGVLQFTDFADDFSWDFNPASFLDGSYIFKVRVFDKAGNYTDSSDVTAQIQKAVTDQEAPTISNFIHGTDPVSGNVTMQVIASDTGGSGLDKIEYYLGTEFLGQSTTGPTYDYIWDSTTTGDATYALYAVAFDGAGNTAIVKHSITTYNNIDTQLPSIVITNPADLATVSGITQITATAADNQGILKVTAYLTVGGIETQLIGTPTSPNPDFTSPYAWTWNTLIDPSSGELIPSGTTVTLRVEAHDIATPANSRDATIDVVVDNTGTKNPIAWFNDPLNGEVFRPKGLNINMSAFDSVEVDHIDVYAYDNAQFGVPSAQHFLGTVSGGNPYQIGWDSSLPDGYYGLEVIAKNKNGFTSDPSDPGAQISVTIDRTPPIVTSFSVPNLILSGTETFTVIASDTNGIASVKAYLYPNPFGLTPSFVFVGTQCNPIPAAMGTYTCTINWNTQLNPSVPNITTGTILGAAVWDVVGNVSTNTGAIISVNN